LADIGVDAKAVPALIAAVKDKNMYAALALSGVGPQGKPAVPFLIAALTDTTSKEQLAVETDDGEKLKLTLPSFAAFALGEIGPGSKAAVPDLIQALESDKNIFAAYALGMIGPEASAGVPALRAALKDTQTPAEKVTVKGVAASTGALNVQFLAALSLGK